MPRALLESKQILFKDDREQNSVLQNSCVLLRQRRSKVVEDVMEFDYKKTWILRNTWEGLEERSSGEMRDGGDKDMQN